MQAQTASGSDSVTATFRRPPRPHRVPRSLARHCKALTCGRPGRPPGLTAVVCNAWLCLAMHGAGSARASGAERAEQGRENRTEPAAGCVGVRLAPISTRHHAGRVGPYRCRTSNAGRPAKRPARDQTIDRYRPSTVSCDAVGCGDYTDNSFQRSRLLNATEIDPTYYERPYRVFSFVIQRKTSYSTKKILRKATAQKVVTLRRIFCGLQSFSLHYKESTSQ